METPPKPPKTCPKCGSRTGWDGPFYRCGGAVALTVGPSTRADEWLQMECRLCRYPLTLPCADANE
jgi:hypothetical protein